MDIEKIITALNWVKSNKGTKSGNFILGLLFAGVPLGFVVWALLSQSGKKSEVIEKKEAQIATLMEREARMIDECAEAIRKNNDECAEREARTMQRYFNAFNVLKAQVSGSVSDLKSIESQTVEMIQQQQNIIQKSTNDETN